MSRPIRARIDPAALEHNLHMARRSTSARIMAVIKAAAYGHGLLRAASALKNADGFALLDMGDAVRLREAGFCQEILLLEGCFAAEDMLRAAELDLACVIHSPHQIAMLDAYPRRNALVAWVKVNTGMNRLGFQPGELAAVMEKLESHPALRDIVLMTHFSRADEAAGMTEQMDLFNVVAAPHRVARSLANSAAMLRFPSTHADWVRPGIMLYGASPFAYGGSAYASAQQLGLKPAMTLSSELIAVRELAEGERVGYGGTFRSETAMRVGIVACGYADGYPRHAPTGTPILVGGLPTRTLGRVSMDMLTVDLTTLPNAKVGSPVTLWGEGMPVDDVARAAGTISYELLCGLTARVPVVVES